MRFSGYIFDVEGTLVDSVQQNLLSLQVCLADFGISVPYELLQLYSGLDGDQTLQLVAPDLNAPSGRWYWKPKEKCTKPNTWGALRRSPVCGMCSGP